MPGQAPLLTLFLGDFYLRRKKIEALINQLIPKENRSFHLIRIDLKEVSTNDLILQARSFPMLGEKQVFWVEGLKEIRKDSVLLLENYFQNPAKWSYLIWEADQLEEGNSLLKLVARFGSRVDCAENERRSGIDLIHRKLKSENRSITKEAWQLLEEKTGGNLTLLDSCIEKLMLYVDEKLPIDLVHATKLVDQFLIYDSFDLTEAISDKNPKKALQVFRFLYHLEGSSIAVIGLLNWQLKRIWQAKAVYEEKGEREVLRVIRISPYRLSGFLRQVERFRFEELERAIEKLFEIDWKSKTGAIETRIALESVIVELASSEEKKELSTVGRGKF